MKDRPRKLFNPHFLLLWQGQFVSQIGTQAFVIAMMYWTMEATGSATLMGVLMMLSMLPGILLAPLGGAVADRFSRKFIIIVSDLIAGVGVVAVALLFYHASEHTNLLLTGLFLIAVTNGVIQAFFRPAILAAIPDLVPTEKVTAANSMNQFSFQFSSVLGQSTGGVLYAFLGAPLLFLIDGLTFLFSGISESFIRIPQHRVERAEGLSSTLSSLHRELIEGLRYVWHWKGMRDFMLLVSLVHFFAMPFIVLMPFFVETRLGGGSDWYGYLMAGFSGGSIIGYASAAAFTPSPRYRSLVLLGFLAAGGSLFGVLGFIEVRILALLTIILAGAFLGVFSINVMTVFQVATRGELRGRVMGLVMTLTNAASPLGMVVGGILGDLSGKNIPLIYGICSAMIVAVVFLVGFRPSVREYLTFDPRRPDLASGASGQSNLETHS